MKKLFLPVFRELTEKLLKLFFKLLKKTTLWMIPVKYS